MTLVTKSNLFLEISFLVFNQFKQKEAHHVIYFLLVSLIIFLSWKEMVYPNTSALSHRGDFYPNLNHQPHGLGPCKDLI